MIPGENRMKPVAGNFCDGNNINTSFIMPITCFRVMCIFFLISYFIDGLKMREFCCFKGQKNYTDISKFSLKQKRESEI